MGDNNSRVGCQLGSILYGTGMPRPVWQPLRPKATDKHLIPEYDAINDPWCPHTKQTRFLAEHQRVHGFVQQGPPVRTPPEDILFQQRKRPTPGRPSNQMRGGNVRRGIVHKPGRRVRLSAPEDGMLRHESESLRPELDRKPDSQPKQLQPFRDGCLSMVEDRIAHLQGAVMREEQLKAWALKEAEERTSMLAPQYEQDVGGVFAPSAWGGGPQTYTDPYTGLNALHQQKIENAFRNRPSGSNGPDGDTEIDEQIAFTAGFEKPHSDSQPSVVSPSDLQKHFSGANAKEQFHSEMLRNLLNTPRMDDGGRGPDGRRFSSTKNCSGRSSPEHQIIPTLRQNQGSTSPLAKASIAAVHLKKKNKPAWNAGPGAAPKATKQLNSHAGSRILVHSVSTRKLGGENHRCVSKKHPRYVHHGHDENIRQKKHL